MKSVMISIQPKWCEKIAKGEKTVEVRKTRPKLETPFKCYIYCTKGHFHKEYSDSAHAWKENALGKVIGEFICDRITPATVDHIKDIAQAACMSLPEMWEYGRKSSAYDLFGWHISDLVIYEKPKHLYEFYKCGAPTIEELDEQLCNYCSRTEYGEKRSCSTPNGYWSCEGAWCDEAYTEYLDNEYVMTRPPQSWCYVEG